jgi:hypothetical protein
MATDNHNSPASVLDMDKAEQLSGGDAVTSPVFILGMMQRCGSNYLSEILLVHPSFGLPSILEEDYVLEHSHLLLEYVDKTYIRWRGLPWIKDPGECRKLLLRRLGDGLLGLLTSQIAKDKRLLAKTPAAYNVEKLLDLFPEAKLLLLIRDGRDVVESAARKWPTEPHEFWVKQWAEGARSVLNFMEGSGRALKGKSWELVRYEELLERPQVVVTSLLRFVGIDPGRFDWDRMNRLPIFGSSQYPDEMGAGRVVEKASDFKPLGRWSDWSWSRKRTFKKLAGNEMVRLGYASNTDW